MITPSRPLRRVLMTADTVGGVWTYALELIRALGESGVEVALATMGGAASPEQRSDARAIQNLSLYDSEYRLPWMDRPWNDVEQAGDWLLELAAQVDADLVHLNEPVFGSLEWSIPVVSVAHSCVLSWWRSVHHCPAPPEWDRYYQAMREGLHHADVVVAPSRWMLGSLRQNYGICGGRVIPNGRAPASLTPGSKSPIVFAAGRLWDPAKNLLALEAIADELRWPVYVAGDPRQPGRQEALSADRLCLLGPLSAQHVASWFRRASIYAFPARYEPFGLSVLEAALAGCALVLGDIPTLRELWDGGAIFISPDDPETLRVAVEGLIEDAGLRQALAMRGRRRALALTPRRMALAYLDLYRTLLTGQSALAQESACTS